MIKIANSCVFITLVLTALAFPEASSADDDYSSNVIRVGMANPASFYCNELGFEHEIVNTLEGQKGNCIFPDGSQCDAWNFLEGKCGQEFSYCSRNGYGIITSSDGKNPFSREYAVCVQRPIQNQNNMIASDQIVGSVTELMEFEQMLANDSTGGVIGKVSDKFSTSQFLAEPPPLFDWRDFNGGNWLTSVKNQGICGSCWAFGVIGITEAQYNIFEDNPDLDLDLSEQYLISNCFGSGGCCGGETYHALKFIKDMGVPDEGCMSYVDGTGCSCSNNCSSCNYPWGFCSDTTCDDRCFDWQTRLKRVSTAGFSSNLSDEDIKQLLVETGPIAMSVNAHGYFDGDIYRCTSDETNHAVVLVGYDDMGGYWVIKNSWGVGWNGDGYYKLGYGECGANSRILHTQINDSDGDDISDEADNCPDAPNPLQEDGDNDGFGDICDFCIGNGTLDSDLDDVCDLDDNCIYTPNVLQEDTYPPQQNNLGDFCDCEGNFDCDEDCDGTDASLFKTDFGRSSFNHPCGPCNGDFDCDEDCDGTDAALFKSDFGRSTFNNPCPDCESGDWCTNLGIRYSVDLLESGNHGGWTTSLKTFDEEWNMSLAEEVEIDIWLNDVPQSLLTAGVLMRFNPSLATILSVQVYDDNDLPGSWESSFTVKVPDYEGPGTYMIWLTSFAGVIPDQYHDIIIAKIRLSCNVLSSHDITFTAEINDALDLVVPQGGRNAYDPEILDMVVTVNP